MNIKLLKSELVKNGYTQARLAEEIGMSTSTFSRRIKKGVFGTDEADRIISILKIKGPEAIFFTNEGT